MKEVFRIVAVDSNGNILNHKPTLANFFETYTDAVKEIEKLTPGFYQIQKFFFIPYKNDMTFSASTTLSDGDYPAIAQREFDCTTEEITVSVCDGVGTVDLPADFYGWTTIRVSNLFYLRTFLPYPTPC